MKARLLNERRYSGLSRVVFPVVVECEPLPSGVGVFITGEVLASIENSDWPSDDKYFYYFSVRDGEIELLEDTSVEQPQSHQE